MLDGAFPARDFHTVVKELIDDALGKDVTFDILFNNSEHQATQLRYGVKRSQQVTPFDPFLCLFFVFLDRPTTLLITHSI